MQKTSWQKNSKWYSTIVGQEGHYYHQKVIIPNSLRLLDLKNGESLLDLACGEGILSRYIPKGIGYYGIDVAKNLIEEAKTKKILAGQQFLVADVSKDLPIDKNNFDVAVIMLALQNIKKPFKVIENTKKHLKKDGRLLIVLNHPCFRIPQKSSWIIEKESQSRKIEQYMSSQEIPIRMNPGKKYSEETWSFHYPLSVYSEMLFDNGFVIEKIEEWVSDKKSSGSRAKIEDSARREFPLFMAILAKKIIF